MTKLLEILQIIFYVIWIPLGLILAFMVLSGSLLQGPRMMSGGPGGGSLQQSGFSQQGNQGQIQQPQQQSPSQQGGFGGGQTGNQGGTQQGGQSGTGGASQPNPR